MRCATPPTLIHTQLTITHLFIAAPYLFETRASAPLLVWPPLQYAPRGDGSARSMGGVQDRPPSLGGASGRPAASLPAPSVVGDPQDLPSLDYELQQLGIKVIHQVGALHTSYVVCLAYAPLPCRHSSSCVFCACRRSRVQLHLGVHLAAVILMQAHLAPEPGWPGVPRSQPIPAGSPLSHQPPAHRRGSRRLLPGTAPWL